MLFVKLGIALQEIDQLHPDGRKRLPEAEDAYRLALQLKMSAEIRVMVMGNLAVLLMSSNRVYEAIKVMQECIQITQRDRLSVKNITGTLFNYGKALSILGQVNEAENAYLEVLIQSRGVDAKNFAKAFASLKHFPKELETEVQCIGNYVLHGSIDSIKCNSSAASWWDHFSLEDKSWILFAAFHSLQNAQDDLSIHQSWLYISMANELQNELLLKSAFPASLFSVKSGLSDPTPIFIVGMPRSGSTLLEQALASHPGVFALGEDTPFAPLVPKIIEEFHKSSPADLSVIGQEYIDEVRKQIPSGMKPIRTVDKMLNNVLNLGFVELTLPSACLLYITRHPMDCALSCYLQPFEGRGTPWAWTLHNIGERYRLIYKLQQHWDRVMPDKVLTVYYEKLVWNFEHEMRRVLKHCGLQWEDSILQFYKNDRAVLTASSTQVRQELFRTSIGRWKKYAKYLQPLNDVLGDIVDEYEHRLRELDVSHNEL
eukprot:g1631.t1